VKWYSRGGKRLFDLLLTVPSMLVVLPLCLCIAALVRWKLGSPVLFRQVRPGLGGQPFEMIKFRTMTDARNAQGEPLPDEERLTPFGLWLRSTSLDELPELLNVLKGDMSLVGPRPLLMRYLPRYSTEQYRRHEVLPGVTGWAQVNGRNALDWPSKFRLDVWYVDRMSLLLDVKILFLTAWKLVRREGITQEGQTTSSEFMGETGSLEGN